MEHAVPNKRVTSDEIQTTRQRTEVGAGPQRAARSTSSPWRMAMARVGPRPDTKAIEDAMCPCPMPAQRPTARRAKDDRMTA